MKKALFALARSLQGPQSRPRQSQSSIINYQLSIPLLLLLALFSAPAQAKYSGGAGTAEEPYKIADYNDLYTLADDTEDYNKCFVMTADIDLNPNLPGRRQLATALIAPDIDSATGGFQGTTFTGTFDGNGYIVRNFTVNQPTSDFIGIFGRLKTNAQLLNIVIEDANITGHFHIGGLVGCNSGGRIRNCYSTGVINGTSYLGGLIGYNYYHARVTMCSSSATVNGTAYYVGGLIGKDEVGFIDFCYATGYVSGNHVGGLVGAGSSHTIIRSCYSTGQVMGSSKGGLIGSGGKAINCFWDIQTSGISTSGGGEGVQGRATDEMQNPTTFINSGWDCFGEIDNGTADWWTVTPGQYPKLTYRESIYTFQGQGTKSDPYLIYDVNDLGAINRDVFAAYRLVNNINLLQTNWSSSIIPEFYGTFNGNSHELSNIEIYQPQGEQIGFIGYLGNGSEIKRLSINGIEINSAFDVGGIVGYSDGIVSDCFAINTLIILSGNRAGGLIGTSHGSVVNCHSSGSISAIGFSVGGLIGEQYYETINNCYSSADVSSDWANVGGLIGLTESASVSNCFSESKVSGINDYTDYVGGLIGYSVHSLISSCWANSQTTGRYYVGGLIGRSSSIIENSYSNGQVRGDIDVGGLVGYNDEGDITNSYATGAVTGSDFVGGLVGHKSAATAVSCYFLDPSDGGGPDNGIGEPLADTEMKQQASFIDWDFIGPADGPNDFWSICEAMNYPKLLWQIPSADMLCPDGVTFVDYSYFADHWLASDYGDVNGLELSGNGRIENADFALFANWWGQTSCGLCGGADYSGDNAVDSADLKILFDNWLGTDYGDCEGAELTGDGFVGIDDALVFSEQWLQSF